MTILSISNFTQLNDANNRPNFDDNALDYDEYYDARPQTPPHRRRYMQSMRRGNSNNNNWNSNRDTRSEDDGEIFL